MEEDKIYYFYDGSLYRKFKVIIMEQGKFCVWKVSALEYGDLETEINIDGGTQETWDRAYETAMDLIVKIKSGRKFKLV